MVEGWALSLLIGVGTVIINILHAERCLAFEVKFSVLNVSSYSDNSSVLSIPERSCYSLLVNIEAHASKWVLNATASGRLRNLTQHRDAITFFFANIVAIHKVAASYI